MAPPVVVLSGASSGIGAALAIELGHRVSARIVLLARRLAKLEEVAEAVREAGGEALPVVCDVVDRAAIGAAVARAEAEFGPIDIAIANAGIGEPMTMDEFDASAIEHMMAINFVGAINLFEAVLPGMLERGSGRIAGVSSIAGFRGLPASGPYSASKAALTTMLESMRLELRHRGISVTAVHPGFVRTPMTDRNTFPMPFLVPVDKAGRIVAKGILKGKRDVNFPWPMIWLIKMARWMPDWAYDRIVGSKRGFKSEKRPT